MLRNGQLKKTTVQAKLNSSGSEHGEGKNNFRQIINELDEELANVNDIIVLDT